MSDFWTQLMASQASSTSELSESRLGLYPIDTQTILMVEGPDSAKFMQGQFTCNLDEINGQQFRRGACCNPKGRMITSFTLAQSGEHQYLMAMSKDLVETAQQHLKKYMVFFKTTMQPTEWVMAGLRGSNAETIIESVLDTSAPIEDYGQAHFEAGQVLKLPFNAGYELWLKPESAENVLAALTQKASLQPLDAWAGILVKHGLAHLTSENSGEHIPQMLNFGQTGGISFNKGCYTGQEIVARMQYLGKLKRHLYRVRFNAPQAPAAHTAIMLQGKSSPVGNLVNTVQEADQTWQALAVLEDKQLNQFSDLTIAGCENLELLDLPYEVAPAEE